MVFFKIVKIGDVFLFQYEINLTHFKVDLILIEDNYAKLNKIER